MTESNTPGTSTTPVEEQKELACGYLVGLDNDGSFVFEIVGKQVRITDLLGLHQVATLRLNSLLQSNQGMGWPLLAEQLTSLLQMVKVMLNTIAGTATSATEAKSPVVK